MLQLLGDSRDCRVWLSRAIARSQLLLVTGLIGTFQVDGEAAWLCGTFIGRARDKIEWCMTHKGYLTLIFLALAGCQTEGIRGNPIEELVAHPYTNGSRINSPPKGNCLCYATTLQDKLKKLYGIDSRLLLLEVTDM